jgi:hypothetical protein
MQGRFNSFQKSMLHWNQMHPYSAVHVVQLRGALDAPLLRACILTTVERRGLTHLRLDHERFTFQYQGGPADCEIRIVTTQEEPFCAMVAEMERQLNLAFDSTGPFSPFRFLVLPGGDFFFLGVVYFHPVADAEAVLYLLKDIVTAYVEGVACDSGASLDLYPDARAHLVRRHPMVVARKLLGFPAQMRDMRQSHRPQYRDAANMTIGFVCFSLPAEDLCALVAAAKSWGVTVNDLFMALLMKALSPCAAARAQARKRRSISIGCIVNLRKDLSVDGGRTFGLFLGSFTVTHAVPAGISLRELAGDIRERTSRIKRRKLYLGTPLELGFARFMLKFFSPARRKKFFAKYYPLWGGITNMNLNAVWKDAGSSAPLDYLRGVSTGPITPLALSVTTVGDRANLGLSYRTAVFSRNDIEGLQCRFREHLEETRRAA